MSVNKKNDTKIATADRRDKSAVILIHKLLMRRANITQTVTGTVEVCPALSAYCVLMIHAASLRPSFIFILLLFSVLGGVSSRYAMGSAEPLPKQPQNRGGVLQLGYATNICNWNVNYLCVYYLSLKLMHLEEEICCFVNCNVLSDVFYHLMACSIAFYSNTIFPYKS